MSSELSATEITENTEKKKSEIRSTIRQNDAGQQSEIHQGIPDETNSKPGCSNDQNGKESRRTQIIRMWAYEYISICVCTYILHQEPRFWSMGLFNRRGRRGVAQRYLGGQAGSVERDREKKRDSHHKAIILCRRHLGRPGHSRAVIARGTGTRQSEKTAIRQ
jgi:hypothetical protein